MLKRFFNKNEVSVEERLDVIENSLVQISNYLYKQENEAERKNSKVLERLDYLIKETSNITKEKQTKESWKSYVDNKVIDLSKSNQGDYGQVRRKIANLFKKETGIDLYAERDKLREAKKREYLSEGKAITEAAIDRITVTSVLSKNESYIKTYIDIVNREHDKHVKRN